MTEEIILKDILPVDKTICYLERPAPPHYPECGFVGYNLTNKHTQRFVQELRNTYEQDLFFNEKQWHDSYVWNEVRNNTTLNGQQNQRWIKSKRQRYERDKDGHVYYEGGQKIKLN